MEVELSSSFIDNDDIVVDILYVVNGQRLIQGTTMVSSVKRENFRSNATSMGVQSQLGILSQVMRVVDPTLHQHLGKLTVFCKHLH